MPAAPSARTKLLDAARALLWERGYEAMSPRSVMDRAGAGQGSLYHHFDGKGGLAAAALELIAADMQARMDALLDPAKPPLERLAAYLSAPREGTKGCRLGRLANETAITGPDADERLRAPLAAYFSHVERAVRHALDEAQTAGDLPAGLDCAAIAQAIVATVQGGYVLSRIHKDDGRSAQTAAGILALLRAVHTVSSSPVHKD